MMEPDGWRWMKTAPTLPLEFEPSEKRETPESSAGERGNIRSGLEFALVGSVGSGRGSPTWSRTGSVRSDHGLVSDTMLLMWRGGKAPGRNPTPQFLYIG